MHRARVRKRVIAGQVNFFIVDSFQACWNIGVVEYSEPRRAGRNTTIKSQTLNTKQIALFKIQISNVQNGLSTFRGYVTHFKNNGKLPIHQVYV
jgi:hypothetical protein